MLLLLLPFIINFIPNAESSLLPDRRCVPTAIVKGPCHFCICSADGIYQCRTRPCETAMLPNLTRHTDLPEITEGESCIPGHLYKMSCNTCRCLANNELVCTKMACLSKQMIEKIIKNKPKRGLRAGNKKRRQTFPDLPAGRCEPGKLYKKGCRICFCTDKGIALCSQKSCKEKLTPNKLNDPEYFESIFPIKDTSKLPSLPHMGSACDRGKSYLVDCNSCFCLANGDLACTQKLCATAEGSKRVTAREKSGLPCTEGYVNKMKCIQCKCVKGLTDCTAIRKCKQAVDNKLSSMSGKMIQVFDIGKQKCIPNMEYRVHCNNCYCQIDGSLRCTQKLCLTNSEAKTLEEQRIYLEKYGL